MCRKAIVFEDSVLLAASELTATAVDMGAGDVLVLLGSWSPAS